MLEIKDLAVQYGHHDPTIEHFNLSMKKGEIISVVGESGSGKTTVIRAVLGALPGAGQGYFSGDILFHGESLLKNSKSDWRKTPWQQDVNDLPGLWRNSESRSVRLAANM